MHEIILISRSSLTKSIEKEEDIFLLINLVKELLEIKIV
jgi:hypothetical protein